jgi:hypothetical protein
MMIRFISFPTAQTHNRTAEGFIYRTELVETCNKIINNYTTISALDILKESEKQITNLTKLQIKGKVG